MTKKTVLATIVIFITWSIMDFIIHGVLLKEAYAATASLWRPEEEMNMPVLWAVTLVLSICFVCIYSCLINSKSLKSGVQYGVLMGVAVGAIGLGSYSYMPIPLSLAFGWFAASLIEILIAGVIVGLMIKSSD